MSALRIEAMREGFEKIHLGDGRVLHWITTPDGEEFHDHPFAIEVEVLKGWYKDQTLDGDDAIWGFGDDRIISPDTSHRIIGVSPGGCLTLCAYGPHERETRFYRQTENGVQSRAWNGSYDDE